MDVATDSALLASELRLILGRLIRRMRSEGRIPIAQLAVLGRLDRGGPATVSALATAERVRPQSMSQTVSELEADGLVTRRPDPTDRRQLLVELTEAGNATLADERRHREGWLARAIAEDLSPAERRSVEAALEPLRRLADD
jgi:DNA-binding MarR family transcriptional regulator